jgi:AraC-like DNA-binding protein
MMLFTLTQALQLAGLIPCIFLMVFLGTLSLRNSQAIIPVFYFLALACGFALPLLALYPDAPDIVQGTLLLGESTLTALTFLLICQFMQSRIPPLPYWSVLAIPLIGGSSLIYANLLQSDAETATITSLYHIFSSSLVFLLLVYYASRTEGLARDDINKKHKYWLIIALIMLHLLVLAVDLARLLRQLSIQDALFAATMFRLTFIYLVMTSLFRVFYPALAGQAKYIGGRMPYEPNADLPHVAKLKALLETDHLYRQMRLNRAALAENMGIGEHHLSRIINHHFRKNFNELINSYRIEEAKSRLKNEPTAITTIAFDVGFNSIASFNRAFRSIAGMSPSEYRTDHSSP